MNLTHTPFPPHAPFRFPDRAVGAVYAGRGVCNQGCGGVGVMNETPEEECGQCEVHACIRTRAWPLGPPCPACNGMGYRPMTEDEEADAAEEQHRIMCEG